MIFLDRTKFRFGDKDCFFSCLPFLPFLPSPPPLFLSNTKDVIITLIFLFQLNLLPDPAVHQSVKMPPPASPVGLAATLRLLRVGRTSTTNTAANQIRRTPRNRADIVRIRERRPGTGFKECLRGHARRLRAVAQRVETEAAGARGRARRAIVVVERDVAAGKVCVAARADNLRNDPLCELKKTCSHTMGIYIYKKGGGAMQDLREC